jgi:hypothetical protein
MVLSTSASAHSDGAFDANRVVMPGLDPQVCHWGVWPERHFSAQRNGDLDADRVSTGAEEMANFEVSA